eukprot:3244444-Amphidinium_carterae.1
METGVRWSAGRWAHYVFLYEGGLHVYNVYGYSSDDSLAPEKNRELLVEILGSAASLGNRPILLGGDWNTDPMELPTDLAHGGSIQCPLSAGRKP